MTETQPPETPRTSHEQQRISAIASRYFWLTVCILAFATLALAALGSFRSTEPAPMPSVEVNPTKLEKLLSDSAIAAKEIIEPNIVSLLDTVYDPAYDAIPEYADFHYSLLGEYIELTEALTGQMSDALYERLFDGFEQRLANVASIIDQKYVEEYQRYLQERIAVQTSQEGISLPLGQVTNAVLQDAMARAQTTLPLAAAAAGIVGSGSIKLIAATIAKKLAAKIAAKASAKGLAKGGGLLTGAGGGALLCAWSGPGAVVCGIVGGTAAWFITDAAIINIDEYYNREDFEAELRAIIDEDRAEKHKVLVAALQQKAAAMDAAVEEVFRMRDLHVND